MENKNVVRSCKYEITMEFYEDGSSKMQRTADGFTAIELIGVLELTMMEIREQMKGTITPDVIKRQVIED